MENQVGLRAAFYGRGDFRDLKDPRLGLGLKQKKWMTW
jgi:hypothetical protein